MTTLDGAFGSLLYTDCLPGQGLRGSGGFQFQAASSGVSREAMSLVQRSALYEPPVIWMREHRPLAEYQPSLTHLFDGVYVTARGVYLGLEANGTREGNQITHALVTADPQCYGQIRPAQLWDAHWWLTQPHPSTECAPVPAEPEIGPLTAVAVREWVLGRHDPLDWLTAVCSAIDRVHDEPRRRVLFISSSANDVLSWLVAATLLLPQTRALRVGFRIFAANPRFSQHDVLAVHPDWAGDFSRPSRDSEFVLFNVDSGWHAEIEPTDGAAYWARRFLACNPYDVIDAVELSAQFAQARTADARPHPSASDRLASSAVLLGEPSVNAEQSVALCSWLVAQPPLPVDEVVVPVCDAVLSGTANLAALRQLDAAMARHGAPMELVNRVRLSLLSAEVDAVLAGASDEDRLADPPHPSWAEWQRQHATERVERAAAGVSPERMDELLRVATRFGVEPRVRHFQGAAESFLRWWVEHPDTGIDPSAWSCGEQLVDMLHDELAYRLAGTMARATAVAVGQYWWRLLWSKFSDLTLDLDRLVASAAVANGDAVTRARTIAAVLVCLRRPDLVGDPEASSLAWAACFDLAAPTTAEMVDFLRAVHPGDLARSVAARIAARLGEVKPTGVSHMELDLLRLLAEHGRQPEELALRQLLASDDTLGEWLGRVRSDHAVPKLPADAVRALQVRSDLLLPLLLDQDLERAAFVVRSGGETLLELLVDILPPIWLAPAGGPRTLHAVAIGFHAMNYCGNDGLRRLYEGHVGNWIVQVPPRRHDQVADLLSSIDYHEVQRFRALVDLLVRRPRKRGKRSAEGEDPHAHNSREKPARWYRRLRRRR